MKLHDAFRLANYQQLTSNNADAARQAAINQARGKTHMQTTTEGVSKSDGMAEIPASELPRWKAFFPDASMKELKEKYNRVHKN